MNITNITNITKEVRQILQMLFFCNILKNYYLMLSIW